jgi:hypothetical protein
MDGLETVAGAAMRQIKDDIPLTLEQVSNLTRTTPKTICYLIQKGRLKGHKNPSTGEWFVTSANLRMFLDQLKIFPKKWTR